MQCTVVVVVLRIQLYSYERRDLEKPLSVIVTLVSLLLL